MGRQAVTAQHPLHRPRVHARAQRVQLFADGCPQCQPREHGPLRLLASHEGIRGGWCCCLPDHGLVGRARDVPRAGLRSARSQERPGCRGPPFAADAIAGPEDRGGRARARVRIAHVRASRRTGGAAAARTNGDCMNDRLRIVIIGLTITSSWGNGHATTYRGLVRELVRRKHRVLFLERDAEWYAANRDLPVPPFGQTVLYTTVPELRDRFAAEIRDADLVVVGSYVPDG